MSNYSHYKQQFQRKKKNTEYKRLFKDCRLYDRGKHFEITHELWDGWDTTGNRYVRKFREVWLATIAPGDIITLTFDHEVDQTVANRLTAIIGHAVGLNKRDYGNYEQHVRVYCGNGWKDSKPYFPGMQFQIIDGRIVPTNLQPDRKKVVDAAIVSKARKEFDTLRKLCKASVRIGAFDEFATEYVDKRWKIPLNEMKDPSTIDLADPTFEDAMSIVAHGGRNSQRPDMSTYDPVTKQYVRLDPALVKKKWLARCVDNGLTMLRREYYKANDGFRQITC